MINFTFIVLFHNNSHTDKVIDAILKQTISGDEIIVVNDNSSIDYLKIFDRFGNLIKIINSDRSGNRSYNRNLGAEYAKNDYILFVDGDIILLQYTVNALRLSMMQGYVGVVGNIIRGNNTPNQMKLITGKQYMELFDKEILIDDFVDLSLIEDRRQKHIVDKIMTGNLWEYFFTAYCAVKKDAFKKVGGFDDNFKGWGVEDDELGYRLNKVGKLEYNYNAYGVHIPHPRDLYKCLYSNRINLYYFLAKSPSNTLEIHMTFGNSVAGKCALDFIKKEVSAKSILNNFPQEKNCIYINEVTKDYPNGLIKFSGDNGELHQLELLGLALPFRNRNFNYAYLSENLFIYPETLAAIILSEAYRVSKEVRIIKSDKSLRIKWNNEQISGLTRISTSSRINYLPVGLCDFDIVDCGDYYKVTGGFAIKMNENFELNENFYMPDLFKSVTNYVMLNLSNTEVSELLLKKIEKLHKIKIINVVSAKTDKDITNLKLSEQLAGDMYRLHTPIIYLVPKNIIIDKSDIWWNSPFRERDLICQNS